MFVDMAREASKSFIRRSFDQRFTTRWLVGDGIDIGAGNDPLSGVGSFFPLMRSVRAWDRADGDAMLMRGVDSESYDFVHSSHCLEHMVDPAIALANWINICKKGGHLVITVPDEDLYEQGVFPSTFNCDHKWTFTIFKQQSWCQKSINVTDLLSTFSHQIEILKIELLDSGFIYGRHREDQTLGTFAESAIEMVLRKKGNGFS
jgi:SAM-dependent methyltransferase